MYKEEAAVELAIAFIRHYKRYDFRFPNIDNIQESKWWIHFLRAAEHRSVEDWNAELWVKCLFEKNGKILPFQLYGKKAEDAFNEFKFKYLDNGDKIKQIISSILGTYNSIKLWCKKNNDGVINYRKYFLENKLKLERNELSEYFLAICRPYWELLQETDDDRLRDKKFRFRKLVVHHNKKLKEKLIEVMGDDFC